MTWALDLDGVVWLAGRGIPGSAEAVAELRRAGERVVFLTNNSRPTVAGHLAALAAVGIGCPPEDLTTSAQAAASLIEPGTRAAVVGDEGIYEALAARGVEVVEAGQRPEVVVVGLTVDLDYWMLATAATAVRNGARLVATNTDATFPTGDGDEGLVPGAGAVVAFVATAAGKQPVVAGKPNEALVALAQARYGRLDVVVGDRPDTDGLLARRVGARFGLVLSGVTARSDLPVQPTPAFVGEDLSSLVRQYLEATARRS